MDLLSFKQSDLQSEFQASQSYSVGPCARSFPTKTDRQMNTCLGGSSVQDCLSPIRSFPVGFKFAFSDITQKTCPLCIKRRLCFRFPSRTPSVCKGGSLFLLILKGHYSNLNSEKSILMSLIFSWKSHSSQRGCCFIIFKTATSNFDHTSLLFL